MIVLDRGKRGRFLAHARDIINTSTFEGQTTLYSGKHNARSEVKIAAVVLINNRCLAIR